MIEKLEKGEGARLRAIRLLALEDAPGAFRTTVNEALRWDPENWESQIEKFPTFIWREGTTLKKAAFACERPLQVFAFSMTNTLDYFKINS